MTLKTLTLREAYERILSSRPGQWKAEVEMPDAGLREENFGPSVTYEKPGAALNVVALPRTRRPKKFEWPERIKDGEGVER
jgi:hypothetical protein